jgi:hypothetical protein
MGTDIEMLAVGNCLLYKHDQVETGSARSFEPD